MSNMKNNVTIDDIKDVADELNVSINEEQQLHILEQYQRVVMDKAESWNVIVKSLIVALIS